ncbi:MAG: hypothetical protein H8E14_11840 [Candidatus Marinimicrobia bacterium]|nr:hypothetical protein [Candidatus Neomarinimicrobiota bacterium]
MKNKWLVLLRRSFDDNLSQPDQEILKRVLAESAELRSEKRRLTDLRNLIITSSSESFRPFFIERVMDAVAGRGLARTPVNGWRSVLGEVFRPVAIAAALTIVGLLILGLSTSGNLSLEGLLGLPEYSLENIVYAME